MSDEMMYVLTDDGTELYDPTYDITIHCESQEEQDKIIEKLKGMCWIPCSEQLPENYEKRYWACTNTGYQCQCRWTNDNWGFGKSNKWTWKTIDIPQYTKVIAWMSLPESYKEVEHDIL